MANSTYRGIQIVANLVHPDDKDYVLGSPGDGSYTIAQSVHVDQQTILGNSIGAGQKKVAIESLSIDFVSLF